MKILYAIQGTGNGHVSRAREILPMLSKYGEVDVLISGIQSDVDINFPIKYKRYGWSFIFGKNGGVNYPATLRAMKNIQILKDIKNFPIKQYDLVINDFEPISAWAAKLRDVPCVALSHQAAYLSSKTPRPESKNWFIEQVYKYYAPASEFIGFHFDKYDYFIHTPVIRNDIRKLNPSNKNHITVYHPAFDDKLLVGHFNKILDIQFEVFSKHAKNAYIDKNVSVFPINSDAYTESLETCQGLITAGGFEAPTEAIFLQKKVMVIPMKGQYEQLCNAEGAKIAGCTIVNDLAVNFSNEVSNWIQNGKFLKANYPNETDEILGKIIAKHQSLREI